MEDVLDVEDRLRKMYNRQYDESAVLSLLKVT